MRDEDLSKLLSEDFDALAAGFETDTFARTLKQRIDARKRMRAGVLGIAGLVGAAAAAAQFNRLFESMTHSGLTAGATWLGTGYMSAIIASLIIATAVIATAAVLQREG